ncbi:MAG TPA: serine hydrolase, partial [Chitinophagales bacterium]|nr:beta-lactamase family protein [Chitinophagales bacterium]HNE46822.1 serine hydrolase [Chitinophagales bacterium]HNM30446.1 serine hydrolase [Chitinophagales bacterium]
VTCNFMKRQTFIILTILFSLTACSQKDKQTISTPQTLDDGWKISEPDNAGFDKQKLEKLIRGISSENPKLNSLVIARHGKLIADEYFNGYTPDSLQKIWSVTKSITGTIIGIAVDKGLLSEKDSIYKYLTDYIPNANSSEGAITIEHLMTMTSGFEWVELGGPKSAGFQLAYSTDWIAFTLNQPHTNVPGTIFNYSTGNAMLLAPIVKKATGQQANEFAKDNLFLPLGITNYEWDTQSEFWTKTQSGELPGAKQPTDIDYKKPFSDFTNTGSGLRMRSRDLCKIGQLYLNRGKWNENQIVSEKWINKSTQSHFGNSDYGYLWRLMNFQNNSCYYATGFGLQRIFVIPTLDLVVVMTQQHYETMPQGEKWINQFLTELLETIKE